MFKLSKKNHSIWQQSLELLTIVFFNEEKTLTRKELKKDSR